MSVLSLFTKASNRHLRFRSRAAVVLLCATTLPVCLFSRAAGPALQAEQAQEESGLRTQAQDESSLRTLPQDELDVVKVLLAQERAWNRGDLNAFATGYKNAPDTTFIGGDVTHGWQQMLDHYRKAYPDKAAMGTLTFSDLHPRLLGEHYAIVTGQYALERSKHAGGNASGVFSLVLEKTPEGWKIILDHTS